MTFTIVCRKDHYMPWGQLPMNSKDIRVLESKSMCLLYNIVEICNDG